MLHSGCEKRDHLFCEFFTRSFREISAKSANKTHGKLGAVTDTVEMRQAVQHISHQACLHHKLALITTNAQHINEEVQ